MPNLQIPAEARPALAKLARLDDRAVDELVQALRSASPNIGVDELVARVSKQVKSIAPVDTKAIMDSLREMSLVKSVAEVPTERFVADVGEAMISGDDVVLTESERDSLQRALTALLAIPSIDTPAKARSLALENANTFCRARILTDIRPVFGSDILSEPNAAVIVNTLRLTYHHGPTLRSLSVALDRDDLDELSDLLDRAKSKTETLHRFLEKSKVEPIDFE
jgi:hypothetical protein